LGWSGQAAEPANARLSNRSCDGTYLTSVFRRTSALRHERSSDKHSFCELVSVDKIGFAGPVYTENLTAGVVVMKSAQDGA
jgi:hypothetical protein